MAKIYLPTDLVNKDCKVVNNDYIRVFDNSSYNTWTDVYFKSGYYLKRGQSNFSNNVFCDNVNTYTDNVLYRFDSSGSFIIFFVICIVCFYFPFRIFGRAFGRWLRV